VKARSPKLFIGPMSVNIVDAVIEFANENDCPLGLIPSRRQVDHAGGYVGWTTKSFSEYVRSKTDKVLLQRDHGGEGQGDHDDDGRESYAVDARHFDLIHVDPWKKKTDYAQGLASTIATITTLEKQNPKLRFEVGTEEAIRPTSPSDLMRLLTDLKSALSPAVFSKISYAVIQSGTSLRETHNTGAYDRKRLAEMLAVCAAFGLASKEHNGDYLSTDLIKSKFQAGLDAINIAPEFGKIETETCLSVMSKSDFETFFNLCLACPRWKKWVAADFDPQANRDALVRICGHYVFNEAGFKQMKAKWAGVDATIKGRIKARIGEIVM